MFSCIYSYTYISFPFVSASEPSRGDQGHNQEESLEIAQPPGKGNQDPEGEREATASGAKRKHSHMDPQRRRSFIAQQWSIRIATTTTTFCDVAPLYRSACVQCVHSVPCVCVADLLRHNKSICPQFRHLNYRETSTHNDREGAHKVSYSLATHTCTHTHMLFVLGNLPSAVTQVSDDVEAASDIEEATAAHAAGGRCAVCSGGFFFS